MAKKLPLRFRLLHVISKKDSVTVKSLLDDLRGEYGHEGQFSNKSFENHLTSMRAVGLIEEMDVDLDGQGHLVETFAITEFGKSRLRYLPRAWK
jgi:DNA-binding PadR family transcriptional regulator